MDNLTCRHCGTELKVLHIGSTYAPFHSVEPGTGTYIQLDENRAHFVETDGELVKHNCARQGRRR